MNFDNELQAALDRYATRDPSEPLAFPVVPWGAVHPVEPPELTRLELDALTACHRVTAVFMAAGVRPIPAYSEHVEDTVIVEGVEESFVSGGADWLPTVDGWLFAGPDTPVTSFWLTTQGRLLRAHPLQMPDWCVCGNDGTGFLADFDVGVDEAGRLVVNFAPIDDDDVWVDVLRWLADQVPEVVDRFR